MSEENRQDPIHVVPVNDKKGHILSMYCPCTPTVETDTGTEIIIHNAFDHRELLEENEKWISL